MTAVEALAAESTVTAAAVAIHDIDCADKGCSGSALGHCYRLARAALNAAASVILAACRAAEVADRAEEIHAEHHQGYIVPSLDSCPEHARADYEAMVADLLRGAS